MAGIRAAIAAGTFGAWVIRGPARPLGDRVSGFWPIEGSRTRRELVVADQRVLVWGRRDPAGSWIGIVAAGRMMGSVQRVDEDELAWIPVSDGPFYGFPVDVQRVGSLPDSEALLADPVLRKSEFVRIHTLGIGWLTSDEVERTEALIGKLPSGNVPPDPARAPGIEAIDRGVTSSNPRLTGAGFGRSDDNAIVEQAAMDVVTAHYEAFGYRVEDVSAQRMGWDISCWRDHRLERRVEVKGVTGPEPRVLLTKGELESASRDNGWELAVVTQARTTPQLRIFSAEHAIRSAVPYRFLADLADVNSKAMPE